MSVTVHADPEVLLPQPGRQRWLSLRARVAAGRLDEELAAGVAPESSDLLFAHALRVVRPSSCAALAGSLRKVVTTAQGPAKLSSRTLTRTGILGAQDALLALAERLVRDGPIHVRGVAQLRVLLSNGSGPLYHREPGKSLSAALPAIVAQL